MLGSFGYFKSGYFSMLTINRLKALLSSPCASWKAAIFSEETSLRLIEVCVALARAAITAQAFLFHD